MAFERHDQRKYARRLSWGRQATVQDTLNGQHRPAWQVAAERKGEQP